MADKSRIEWTDATWNPVTGCSKVSQGCKNCYAERDWPRLAAPRPKSNVYTGRAFTDVRHHEERLDEPLRLKKPRRIFVNSMSDLFHEDVPNTFILDVFDIMERAHWHTFQILTKRPERMIDVLGGTSGAGLNSPPLPNVWLGVSVEDQATADERIPLLLLAPAAIRWISAEPLLGPLDLSRQPWLIVKYNACQMGASTPARIIELVKRSARDVGWRGLDWVVAGGESGPRARPSHPGWFRLLRDQCAIAGVPFFFKQWGEWGPLEGSGAREPTPVAFWRNNEWNPGITTEQTAHVVRIGKQAAGNLLDGRKHEEYPNIRSEAGDATAIAT